MGGASKIMFNKENKKLTCHHGVLAHVIAVFLGLILIVLIFKVGLMAGMSKTHFSSCSYQENLSGHMGGKFISLKKSAYSSYQEVVKLTESGFVVKDSGGTEQTVVVNEDTVIIKGKEKLENGVSVGDKVYVAGPLIEASMVKILDFDAVKLKK